MTKAFIFGKFMPFHKGHQEMIQFALSYCDMLTVLVCKSDKETMPGELRKKWIEEVFKDHPKVSVSILHYKESELPNTSVSAENVSKIWANKFMELFPDYDLVITSEPYGDFVSRFMNIRHIAYDIAKKKIPVSATRIRSDLFSTWHYLPDAVKKDYALKVVINGTESTGKTTLTEKLAAHFGCSAVLEVGRELISDSKHFTYDDLEKVAIGHAKKMDLASIGPSPLIIIDTDVHITKSYARFALQKELIVSPKTYQMQKASLYLYLNNDVEYVQDGTRLSESDRNRLDQFHRQILQEHGIQSIEISGNWEDRFQKAVEAVNSILLPVSTFNPVG